ncbi:SH3 domain-containing protein [Desulfocapsa sulfexigens DSM 10523]|uniref:SH3 domain-containing protein n=1 Tax=Desulfocapsa sulfexigens (strain DSM 10523 / SB164P1) TaxID=1167006 RepID=M1NHK1_DESSD|nr:SH3 domain-containing protein [Desulfocapsa sulfexigens]AGF79079.1 SH3 domain-containing protein [Desulfocapsa sulfexigens DSM 10523]
MTTSQSVQVRSSQLRKSPSFLGKIISTVHYGDRLAVLETKDSWLKVDARGNQGWLHSSAMTTKEIVLKPHAGDISKAADSDEIALAGKGFNRQVEKKFRQRNANANFNMVDKMEKSSVSQEEIEAFLKAGNLHPTGGEV